jgi:hypothetical protein
MGVVVNEWVRLRAMAAVVVMQVMVVVGVLVY